MNSKFLAALTASTVLAGLALSPALAAGPTGLGYELTIPVPQVTYPLPVVDNYVHQTGKARDGREFSKYDDKDNPIIEILGGFDKVWSLNDPAWANGGADGKGPDDYSNAEIRDPQVWADNMAYVLKVTGKKRTDAQALAAYLDDRRPKHYSVIDGLGPLAELYKQGAGASTSLPHTLETFDVNKVIEVKEEDKGTGPGVEDSDLGAFVTFMNMMRGPEGTTSPSKYFFSSPRPWRMTDTGDVVQTGTETIADKTYETYDSNVQVVPALKYVRETRGRRKDGGFPSGHTNAAFLSAIAYAYAFPERFGEMLTRASELGEDRILAGMHSPLDVMGGRTMATAVAAAYLNDPAFAEAKTKAFDTLHKYFSDHTPDGVSLYDWAHSKDAHDRFANMEVNKAVYRQRMTYDFHQDPKDMGQAMIVPKGAEVLLETRYPYLSAEQRRVVLASTGLPSGYPVLDETNGWGRLDLAKAADGYGRFDGDVRVEMWRDNAGLNAFDTWGNSIAGAGRLEKTGDGTLALTGANSFTGGVLMSGGTLVAASQSALGLGSVHITDGTLALPAPVRLGDDYWQDAGELKITVSDLASPSLVIDGHAEIDGGKLVLSFSGEKPALGTSFQVISAAGFEGAFDSIEAEGLELDVLPGEAGLTLVVKG